MQRKLFLFFRAFVYLSFASRLSTRGIFLSISFEGCVLHTYTHTRARNAYFRVCIWDARTRKCRFYGRKQGVDGASAGTRRKPYKWPHLTVVWGRITDLKCEIVAKCARTSPSCRIPCANECEHLYSAAFGGQIHITSTLL